MKTLLLGLIATVALSAASTAQAQVYNANPTVGFTYGAGNDYSPANAVVLTTADPFGSRTSPPLAELALRAHVPTLPANPSTGAGVYSFALGSDVSFDFSAFGTAITGATVTVTNLLTGGDASFAALLLGSVQPNGALQGSQRFSFGFLNGNPLAGENINFNSNVNSTYRIDLAGGGQTISAFAQLGEGGVRAAVPEPGTWGMMLVGFGAMGVALRRRRRTQSLLQAA